MAPSGAGLATDDEDGGIGVGVGVVGDSLARFGVEVDGLVDADVLGGAEFLPIKDGKKAAVGRFVPGEVKQALVAAGASALLEEHAADLVISEVGEADDASFTDAEDFVDDGVGADDGLERLGEDDVVELLVGEIG